MITFALNALTVILCYSTLIYIGKFFCVRFFEAQYDAAYEDDMDTGAISTMCYCFGLFFTVCAWLSYYFDFGYLDGDRLLLALLLVFGSFCVVIHFFILVCTSVVYKLVPFFEDLHSKIRAKKRGE